MKKILAIIMSVLLLFSLSAVVSAEEKQTLVVAVSPDYPPFEYYEDETLAGFDIELMNAIGEKIGCKIEYKTGEFDAMMMLVIEGEADCAISTITVTPEREQHVRFTREYLISNATIVQGFDVVEEYQEKYGIIFPKRSEYDELYSLVDNAIQQLKADGTTDNIAKKYELDSLCKELSFGDGEMLIFNYGGGAIKIDKPSDWAKADVDRAYTKNIPDSALYQFATAITREEFAEMIFNLITEIKGNVSSAHPSQYTDTANPKMIGLSGLGIIKGKSETLLAPDDLLTREEAATILDRTGAYLGITFNLSDYNFADEANISDWAKVPVQNMSSAGIMKGIGEDRFDPKGTYTVEQAMVTLVRMYDILYTECEFYIIDFDGNVIISHEDVTFAEYGQDDDNGKWFVIFDITPEAAMRFAQTTKEMAKYSDGENYISIYFNGEEIARPRVSEEIKSETVVIAGDFTEEVAKSLVGELNKAIK